jgi:diguanylate cyclase (GGDEF)-like protein/PAS domain S-box-containing protein
MPKDMPSRPCPAPDTAPDTAPAAVSLPLPAPLDPAIARHEVLDRLGPSIFAGLLDTDGVLRYANHAALRAIDSTPEQVLGRPFDATPWWQACDHSRWRLRQAVASAARGEASRFDVRVAVSGGATLSMDFSLLPLHDPEGRVVWLIPSARDVSDREQAQRQLQLTRLAVEQASDALMQVGPDGAVRDANAAACRLLGVDHAQLLRLRVPDIDIQVDATQWPQRWRALCERGALRFETSIRHQEGHEIPVDVSVSLVTSDEASFAHVCIDDLRERRAAERRIRQLVEFDQLTGLPNRRLLFERLGATLQTGSQTAVLVLELDRFKRINDGLGPHVGDAVLREAARRIAAAVRSIDLVARRGGDEFVVVMPSVLMEAVQLARALLAGVACPMTLEGHEVHLTCSIGIAIAPADGDHADTLLRHANAALHQAKRLGRNQISVYAGASHDDDPERLVLETALRHALRDDQLELHYQPQVDLRHGRIVGVEALLRWRHPTLGGVAPDRFIPIAEETGLIVPIGEWVLRRAMEQASLWQRLGLPPLRMAVNLSARQLLLPDLARRIEDLLAVTGLDPRLFGVEVTESMLIGNFEQAVAHLRTLRALGVEVSLDDFGTGYSSLSYLRRLPVDVVKIDRSLVPDVTAPAEDVSITRAIITMAHQLRMKALAEGVESEGQAALLAANRCDQMQGYWFSAALPAPRIEAMLREGRRIDVAPFGRHSRQRALSRFLARRWDVEQLRSHLREAFASKDMADRHRQLGQELQTARKEIDDLNRQLQRLLNVRLERNRYDIDPCETAQDVLDAIPVPVLGIDDDGQLTFANASAQALCGLDGDPAEVPATERLLPTLRQALHDDLTLVTLAKRQWWAMCRPLGDGARGRLLVLLPQTGEST